jgi:hypothetical protein
MGLPRLRRGLAGTCLASHQAEYRNCAYVGLESSLLIVLLIVLLLYMIISIVNCRVRFLNLLYNKKGITWNNYSGLSKTMCCFLRIH